MLGLFKYQIKSINGVDHKIAEIIELNINRTFSFCFENMTKNAIIKDQIIIVRIIDRYVNSLLAHNMYFLK